MENVPFATSEGFSLPPRARSARSRRCTEISPKAALDRLRNHRTHHAVGHGHRDADVDVGIHLDSLTAPGCIHLRMFFQDTCNDRHQQIRDGQFHAAILFDARSELGSNVIQCGGVQFTDEKEVRNLRPALCGAFGHQPRNRAERTSASLLAQSPEWEPQRGNWPLP